MEYIGKICDGLFNKLRYLPNSVAVSIELQQSSDMFCLSAPRNSDNMQADMPNETLITNVELKELPAATPILNQKFKVELQEAFFYIRRQNIHAELLKPIQQNFANGKKAYFLWKLPAS